MAEVDGWCSMETERWSLCWSRTMAAWVLGLGNVKCNVEFDSKWKRKKKDVCSRMLTTAILAVLQMFCLERSYKSLAEENHGTSHESEDRFA